MKLVLGRSTLDFTVSLCEWLHVSYGSECRRACGFVEYCREGCALARAMSGEISHAHASRNFPHCVGFIRVVVFFATCVRCKSARLRISAAWSSMRPASLRGPDAVRIALVVSPLFLLSLYSSCLNSFLSLLCSHREAHHAVGGCLGGRVLVSLARSISLNLSLSSLSLSLLQHALFLAAFLFPGRHPYAEVLAWLQESNVRVLGLTASFLHGNAASS